MLIIAAAENNSPGHPSNGGKDGRHWWRWQISDRIVELQHQVTELERKMQSGVVVVCNCIPWNYPQPVPTETGVSAIHSDSITISNSTKARVKGYGYNTVLAKWDAINTCWNINGYKWGPGGNKKKSSSGPEPSDPEPESIRETEEQALLKVEESESQGMKCRHIRNWNH